MNVSAWCIRNPVPAVLLFVALTLAGLQAFSAMKVQTFPDIDLPTVVVVAAMPGATPLQLEADVARPVEQALTALDGVRHVRSRIQDGRVTTSVEWRLEHEPQAALEETRAAVARLRDRLPAGMPDPQVLRLNLAGSPILTYTIASARRDRAALSLLVDQTVSRTLRAVRGVGGVTRVGGVDREVLVALDPLKLMALGASAGEVSRQLRQAEQDAPAGRVETGGVDQPIRALAGVNTAADLAAMDIALADGRRVRLGDLATVHDGPATPRSAALLDGQPVVAFEVVRAQGASEVEVAEGVRRALDGLRAEAPDLQIHEVFSVVEGVQANFRGSMALLIEGAVLAIVVVGLFLRDWRATLVAATALPLSVLPALAVMHHGFGLTINVLTLLSLSLVIGVLVDDAIVEIENIVRHLHLGLSPEDAAREAADEIGLAVVATTFTLIAVFLPSAFLAGVPGRFFVHFGITAAVAVFFSLVVARMLTPMMAARLLRRPSGPERPSRWRDWAVQGAGVALRHRGWTVLATLALLAAAIAGAARLPTGFMPADDMDQTQVRLTLQPGSRLADTLASAEAARRIVGTFPAVRQVFATLGAGNTGSNPFEAGGAAEVRTATLTLQLQPREQRQGVRKAELERELRLALQALPGARVQVGFGGSGERFTLMLRGDDGAALAAHAQQVERQIRALPGVADVQSSASLSRQELQVQIDPGRAADAGVSTAAIADTLRVATSGDLAASLARLELDDRSVPVVVRLPDGVRDDLGLLSRLPVPGARGPVPLGNVAAFALVGAPLQIDRLDRQRLIELSVALDGRALGEVAREVMALPGVTAPPRGVSAEPAGDSEAMAELFDSFALAMGAGVLCIYIVMVLLFREFAQPFSVLGALLLSLPGAVLALWLTGAPLSMPSLIGLVMLMGITTKNAILLVDYVILARRAGLPRHRAVLDAVHKRARPIVMTTLAMAAGMLPTALGWGVDPGFRAPMAVVAIGGLITSTVLSLLVIPVLYTLIDDAAYALRRRLQRGAVQRRWA